MATAVTSFVTWLPLTSLALGAGSYWLGSGDDPGTGAVLARLALINGSFLLAHGVGGFVGRRLTPSGGMKAAAMGGALSALFAWSAALLGGSLPSAGAAAVALVVIGVGAAGAAAMGAYRGQAARATGRPAGRSGPGRVDPAPPRH